MAFRMICRSLSSTAVMAAALPKTAAVHVPSPGFVGLRHAAGLVSRTAWQRQPTTLLSLRQFTPSAAVKNSLTDALQGEIDHENETYQPPEVDAQFSKLPMQLVAAALYKQDRRSMQEVASGPPAPWQLTETPGDTHMTLTKHYNNEKLQIDLMVNDQPVDPGDAYSDSTGQEEPQVDVGIVFNASIIKGEQALVFECKSDGEYLEILHISLEQAEEDPEESTYTGPVYSELDEKLLLEFPAFLEKRGIDPDLAAYLLALVDDKEQREYSSWLGNVKTFLSKR